MPTETGVGWALDDCPSPLICTSTSNTKCLKAAYATNMLHIGKVMQVRPASPQVLAVHNTAPVLPAARLVAAPAEPVISSITTHMGEGQIEAASQASLDAMAQACQAADT